MTSAITGLGFIVAAGLTGVGAFLRVAWRLPRGVIFLGSGTWSSFIAGRWSPSFGSAALAGTMAALSASLASAASSVAPIFFFFFASIFYFASLMAFSLAICLAFSLAVYWDFASSFTAFSAADVSPVSILLASSESFPMNFLMLAEVSCIAWDILALHFSLLSHSLYSL